MFPLQSPVAKERKTVEEAIVFEKLIDGESHVVFETVDFEELLLFWAYRLKGRADGT